MSETKIREWTICFNSTQTGDWGPRTFVNDDHNVPLDTDIRVIEKSVADAQAALFQKKINEQGAEIARLRKALEEVTL